MTVREMREALAKFPPDMVVIVEGEAEFVIEGDDTLFINDEPQICVHIETRIA